MSVSIAYTQWRARLRNYVSGRETLLNSLRLLRYGLIQGPWHPWLVRWRQAHDANPPFPATERSLFTPLDLPAVIGRIREDAFAPGLVLPRSLVDEIEGFARILGDTRINNPHLDYAPIHRLAHDPQIAAVARGYLGAEPILFRTQLYWTFPRADAEGRMRAAAEGGRFHYDIADSRALTVFVYLTDVDEDCGPHVVVVGTHGKRSMWRSMNRFISDEDVERRFRDRVRVVTGPRGTAWFEDITCYHRQAPAAKTRLMLIMTYTLHRRPVAGDLPSRGGQARAVLP